MTQNFQNFPYSSTASTKTTLLVKNLFIFGLISTILCQFFYELWMADFYSKSAVLSSISSENVSLVARSMPKSLFLKLIFRYSLLGPIVLGLLALLFWGKNNAVSNLTKISFYLLQAWMILHSIIAFSSGPPMALSELHGSKGPLIWLSCSMVFVGVKPDLWRIFLKLITILTFIAAIVLLFKILQQGQVFEYKIHRQYFYMKFISLLIWTSPFLLYAIDLKHTKISTFLLTLLPFILTFFAAIFSSGRSWIIVIFLHSAFLIVKFRKNIIRSPKLLYFLVFILPVIIALFINSNLDNIHSIINFLSRNWAHDTRSSQYIQFFSQISWLDLIIGKGPRATWIWLGRPYDYIDGAFTLLAFIGGLPLLGIYILLIIVPAFNLLKTKPPWQDCAPAMVVLFWTLAMVGLATFTSPRISYEHTIICIMAGRCHYLLKRQNILNSTNPKNAANLSYHTT